MLSIRNTESLFENDCYSIAFRSVHVSCKVYESELYPIEFMQKEDDEKKNGSI